VLLVDDEPDLAATAAEYMEERHDGLSVVTAESAREGVRKLDGSIDCVVSDYEMPRRDGLQFLRVVREEFPELPFVLLTGKGSERVASEAISAGVDDYVRKTDGPDGFDVLVNRVLAAVERRRAAAAADEADRRLRELFDRVTDAVLSLDADWRVTHANAAAGDLFGVDPDSLEGNVLWVAFPDAIGTEFQDRLEAAADRAEPTTFEEFFPPRFTWLSARVYPAEDGCSVYLRELDDVLATEGDPRALVRQFRAVFEAASDAMLLVDDEGVVREVNPAAEALSGRDGEAMVGEPLASFVRAEDGLGLAWTGVAADDRRAGEATFVGADGEGRPVRFEVADTLPGGFLLVLEPRDG